MHDNWVRLRLLESNNLILCQDTSEIYCLVFSRFKLKIKL